MAKRGRPYEGKPFQRKNAAGERSGSYMVYDPLQKKQISLETDDESSAIEKVKELFGGLLGQPLPKAPEKSSSGNSGTSLPPDANVGATSAQHSGTWARSLPTEPVESSPLTNDGIEALDEWSKRPVPGQQPIPFNEVKSNETSTADWFQQSDINRPSKSNTATPILSVPKAKPTKKGGFTPEQAERLGSLANKIVTRLNIAGIAACVKYLGKDPVELDEDDIELLQTGWEMFLADYFIKQPPQPWMIILAGNLLLGFQMYTTGKDIPKPQIADSTPSGVTQIRPPR